MSNKLRVIVTIKEGANPELHEALVALPREERSERLRCFATMGALIVDGGICGVSGAPQATTAAEPTGDDDAPRAGDNDVQSGVLTGFDGGGWQQGEG